MKFNLRSILVAIVAVSLFAFAVNAVAQSHGTFVAVAGVFALAVAFAPRPGYSLGANTLTNLIPDAYAALNVVSRELVGFVGAVNRDSSADRVAKDQTLRIPVAPANAAGADYTPAMALPSASDQTFTNETLTITKSRKFPFSWTGEEQRSVEAGPGFLTLQQQQIAEAMRAAVNEVEADCAAAFRKGASRAYGTSGTTPFASDLSDTANVAKILDDNGAPMTGRQLVINTTATAKLRTLTQLTKANEAGSADLLRNGVLMDVHGFAFRQSAALTSVTKGTGASYVLNGSHAAGATSITVKTGSGTILAGDVITINSQKYVVKTGIAAAGTLVINKPGLLAAGSDGDTVTVNNNFTPSVAFTRNAFLLATRIPQAPREGDLAIMKEIITDPVSGLSFELAVYPGYGMLVYEIRLCWGVSAIKAEHAALLLG